MTDAREFLESDAGSPDRWFRTTNALLAVLDLCDTSKWLNAEAAYWFGEWVEERYAPPLHHGYSLSRTDIEKIESVINETLGMSEND